MLYQPCCLCSSGVQEKIFLVQTTWLQQEVEQSDILDAVVIIQDEAGGLKILTNDGPRWQHYRKHGFICLSRTTTYLILV